VETVNYYTFYSTRTCMVVKTKEVYDNDEGVKNQNYQRTAYSDIINAKRTDGLIFGFSLDKIHCDGKYWHASTFGFWGTDRIYSDMELKNLVEVDTYYYDQNSMPYPMIATVSDPVSGNSYSIQPKISSREGKTHREERYVTSGRNVVRDEVYNDAAMSDLAEVYIYTYDKAGTLELQEIYDNTWLSKNGNYQRYTSRDDGVPMNKHYYRDGKWHREYKPDISYGTENHGAGSAEVYADEVYIDPDLTQFERTIVRTFYASMNKNTIEFYDNKDLNKNTNYESRTYAYPPGDAASSYLVERVYFKNNEWHREMGNKDLVYSDIELKNFIVGTVRAFYDSGNIKSEEIYRNPDLIKDNNYEKYTYADDGTLIEMVLFKDNMWHKRSDIIISDGIPPARTEFIYKNISDLETNNDIVACTSYTADGYGKLLTKTVFDIAIDNKWHKLSNFITVSGIERPQNEIIYNSLSDLNSGTNPMLYNVYGYDPTTGSVQVKEVYDNIGSVKNNNYEKHTYTSDGVTLVECISYFNSNWHKESEYTVALGDGKPHSQRDEVYSDIDLTTLVAVGICDYYQTGKMRTREVYDNIGSIKNNNYEKHTYAGDGKTLIELISYFDSNWHKESRYTVALGDGKTHSQKDEVCSDIDLTTLVAVGISTFYSTGNVQTRAIYDNASLIKNPNHRSYSYESDGATLKEQVYYQNSVWHRDSDYTPTSIDGQRRARREETYYDADLNNVIEVAISYYEAAKLKTKSVYTDKALTKVARVEVYAYNSTTGAMDTKEIYDNISQTKNTNYQKYAYAADGATLKEKIYFSSSDNKWHKESEYVTAPVTSQDYAQKEEIYANINLTTRTGINAYAYTFYNSGQILKKDVSSGTNPATVNWVNTYWYFESGRVSKTVAKNGAISVYFDEDGGKKKMEWTATGTINYWNTSADYDAKKKAWSATSALLQVYTYYDSGRVRYIDWYTKANGAWKWNRATEYKDAGGTLPSNRIGTFKGAVSQAITGASTNYFTPIKPERSDEFIGLVILCNGPDLLKGPEPVKSVVAKSPDQIELDARLTVQNTVINTDNGSGVYSTSPQMVKDSQLDTKNRHSAI